MRVFFGAVLLLVFALPVMAYNPIFAEPNEPYEVIGINGDLYVQQHFLGDLDDYPDMYEFTTDVAIDLTFQLRQRIGKKAVPFGLIIVRKNENDGGVTEIIRNNEPLESWDEISESGLGIKFLETRALTQTITPGTYRIEVSTPDNRGAYMLRIGTEPSPDKFLTSLVHIYRTQRHFGYTPLHMVFSSYVYYPIGIGLILFGIHYTFKRRYLFTRDVS